MASIGKTVSESELRPADILKQIITENKAEIMLAKCLMLVFSEVGTFKDFGRINFDLIVNFDDKQSHLRNLPQHMKKTR